MALQKIPLSPTRTSRAKVINFVPVKDKVLRDYYKKAVDDFSDHIYRGDYKVGFDTLASLMSVFYDHRSEIVSQLNLVDLANIPDLKNLKEALEFLKDCNLDKLTHQVAQSLSSAFSVIQNNSISSEDGNLLLKGTPEDNLNTKVREAVANVCKNSQKTVIDNVTGEQKRRKNRNTFTRFGAYS